MPVRWLTKSLFQSGRQCAKRLWFEVHEPLEGPAGASMQKVNGQAVDQVVWSLQAGVRVPREAGMAAAVDETRRYLQGDGPEVLYQGAFRADPLAAVADILRRASDAWDLVEVKSSTKVKDEHLPDVAFQTLVLERTGLPVARACIAHVNNEFVLKRPDDYAGMLVEIDVTSQVRGLLPMIAEQAAASIDVMTKAAAPNVPMGDHCEDPFPCPFRERCEVGRGSRTEFPISILPRGGKVVAQLAAEGYEDLRTVPAERLTNAVHRRVHTATVRGGPLFDAQATRELRALKPPFAYLDFETINFAVPEVRHTSPYEQYPFQWSAHVEESDGSLRHAEYLAIESFGDLRALAVELLAALPGSGPVFVYNRSLEKPVLERLARRIPDFAPPIQGVIGRLVDLLPITREAYYHPAMKGSWSIKAVLPTIDPGLAYHGLEEVRGGEDAQLAFVDLREGRVNAQRRTELLQHLRIYCERDTYGMVILRRFLCAERGHPSEH